MRTFLLIVGLLGLAIVIYFFVLGVRSKSGQASGLSAGELAQCGHKPNCVCSEHKEKNDSFIEPIALPSAGTESLTTIKAVIADMGGEVVKEEGDYLAATFTSKLFGFVDDIELRLDRDNAVLHVRSASRVGHSDLGANRKRVEVLREQFQQQSSQS